jgi:hypothetical protein
MIPMKNTFALILFALISTLSIAQKAARMNGEILVMLNEKADISAIVNQVNLEIGILPNLKTEKLISPAMRTWLLSFDESQIEMREILYKLQKAQGVQFAQVNHIIADRVTTPDDPFFGQQWHHNQVNDHDIDTDLAWDITTGGLTATGDEIVACVVETQGAKWDQADILANHWVNENEIPDNGIDDDNNGYVDDYDGWNISNDTDNFSNGNHGTQVSSMIGAKGNNATGITGVNWDVKLMQVQMGGISEANVVEAYTYPMQMRKLYNQSGGSQGAFVVVTNSSWGTDFGQPADAPIWCAMYDSLGVYGVLSCGATSNSAVNIDAVGDLPTACPSEFLLSITATDNNDVRDFAGYGQTTIDLGAPGDQVYLAGNTNYGNTSGTSFASPCTAGGVALLYSAPCTSIMAIAYADPEMAASLIKGYIMDGTDAVSNLTTETVTGGRLNVNNSLNLLLENCSSGDCIAPFAIQSTQTPSTTNYTITWATTDLMTSFFVQYRIQGGNWILSNELFESSYSINDLLTCTDYEVQVSANCADSQSDWSTSYFFTSDGCCENPSGVTVTGITENSVVVSWNSVLAAASYTLVYMPEVGFETIIDGISVTSYTLTNLAPCTNYSVYVYPNCISGELPPPSPIYFSTFGCGACQDLTYCETSGTSTLEWIAGVSLNTLDNATGDDDGYADYTSLGTILQPGGSYEITLTPGFSGSSFSEYFKAWIDYNSNGVFDTNELVFDSNAGSNAAVSGTVTVPLNATAGSVRMRVSMAYVGMFGGGNPPTACGAISDGEAEDYCITIDGDVAVSEKENAAATFTLFPNPATDLISWTTDKPIMTIEVYSSTGTLVSKEGVIGKNQINIYNFAAGIYTLRATNSLGQVFIKQVSVTGK